MVVDGIQVSLGLWDTGKNIDGNLLFAKDA